MCLLPERIDHIWRMERVLTVQRASGFPGGSKVKAAAHNAEDPGSMLRSGRSPGEGNGTPFL